MEDSTYVDLAPLLNEYAASKSRQKRNNRRFASTVTSNEAGGGLLMKLKASACPLAVLTVIVMSTLVLFKNSQMVQKMELYHKFMAGMNIASGEYEDRRFTTHDLVRQKYNGLTLESYEAIVEENFQFDISGEKDVMVFLHIQKTGGTIFGKHLVQDIDLDEPCRCHKNPGLKNGFNSRKNKKRKEEQWRQMEEDRKGQRSKRKLKCECFRPGKEGKNWLFSRFSTGWKCGLHPDWTELTSCVDRWMEMKEGRLRDGGARRYFYVTFLRDPVARYLSEFRHVQRGATWKTSHHVCGGREATPAELPSCYAGEDWSGVELEEFVGCGSNLANNRQTWMLADLRLVNCYNRTGMSERRRGEIMLQSAKENLERMAFFGLTEYQMESQYLFEEVFNLKFRVEFVHFDKTMAAKTEDVLSEAELRKIRQLNSLDIELYDFAERLLKERFREMKEDDQEFSGNFTTSNSELRNEDRKLTIITNNDIDKYEYDDKHI